MEPTAGRGLARRCEGHACRSASVKIGVGADGTEIKHPHARNAEQSSLKLGFGTRLSVTVAPLRMTLALAAGFLPIAVRVAMSLLPDAASV